MSLPNDYAISALTGKKGDSGTPAKFIEIEAPNGLVFKNGSPNSITLNALPVGFTPSSYVWKKNGTAISGQTSSSLTIAKADVTSSATYSVEADGCADYVTVIAVTDGVNGTSPYACSLSNENFTIATDLDLKPLSGGNYDCVFTAYKGTTQLTAVASNPSTGQFSISQPSGLSKPSNNTLRFVAGTSAISANAGYTITVNYEGSVTETKTISVSAGKQGNTGKNAIVMTSATTPSGDYVGQVGFWQGQPYTWNGTTWDKQIGDLPTDAVLHYSFDEVPDLPDGTAIYRKNADWGSTDDWGPFSNNGTISIENGILTSTRTATQLSSFQHIFNMSVGTIVKLKLIDVSDTDIYIYRVTDGTYVNIKTLSLKANIPNETTFVISSASTSLIIRNASNVGAGKLQIEEIYIGNGSYSTPIIDNSGNSNHATNNGGIAVEGVSGKGGYFLNGKYADLGTDFQLNPNFTVSVWVKPDTVSSNNGDIFAKYRQFILRNGASWYNGLMIYLYGKDTTLVNSVKLGALPINEWSHIVITRNATTLKYYKNGILLQDLTLADSTLRVNTNNVYVGGINTAKAQSIDDLLIFNRALSNTEVQALYQNKANTPKYYDLSDYQIEGIDDDGVISPTEKQMLYQKWIDIYAVLNGTTITKNSTGYGGEYQKMLLRATTAGVSLEVGEGLAFINATEALRAGLWTTANLQNMSVVTKTSAGAIDTLFNNYRTAYESLSVAIDVQNKATASALSISQSNSYHQIPTDANGDPTQTGLTGTDDVIYLLEGESKLTCVATGTTLTAGQWKITNIAYTDCRSNTTKDNYTISDKGAVIAGLSNSGSTKGISADSAKRTFSIEFYGNNASHSETISVVQSFAKAKAGADGSSYKLIASSYCVKSGTDVTFNAQKITGDDVGNFQGYLYKNEGESWSKVGQFKNGSAYASITQTLSGDTDYRLCKTDVATNFVDEMSVKIFRDGIDGLNGEDGTNGTNTWYSSVSATTSTTSIALSTITAVTGHTVSVGDLIIANSLVFLVTAVDSTNATVSYKQGIKGATGVSMRSKGAWTASTAYVNNTSYIDVVSYNGSSYACKTSHTSGSAFDSSKWNLLADRGDDGVDGTKTFTSDITRSWTDAQWADYSTVGRSASWNNSTVEGMRVNDIIAIPAILTEQGNITGIVYAKITSIPTSQSGGVYSIPSVTLYGQKGTRGSLTFIGTEIFNIRASAVAYTLTTASTGIISNTMSILVGDRYINSLTYDVWKCTTAGTASTAKWTYEGRQADDKDNSNQFRFFGDGTRTKYNTVSSSITQSEVSDTDPFGGTSKLWKVTRPANVSAGGYATPYTKAVKIESGFNYRYACYVKRTTSSFTDYFAARGYTSGGDAQVLSLAGASVNSAYFTSTNNFGTLNRWYLVIGYVTANGVTTAPSGSGVYDMVTKKKVKDVTNYQFKNITEYTHTGTLIGYTASATTPTAETSIYVSDIRFDKLDGTEPSLDELLDLNPDRTLAFRVNYSTFSSANNGEVYVCGYNSKCEEADVYGRVIVNGVTYYTQGMLNSNCAMNGYVAIQKSGATSSASPARPVYVYQDGSGSWYQVANDLTTAAKSAISSKADWIVIAKIHSYSSEGVCSLEPMTPCLLSDITDVIKMRYEGIVAAVTNYTSAQITTYKITGNNGSFTKSETVPATKNVDRGALVLNTNAITPTSSTAQARMMLFDGTTWTEINSNDARYNDAILLCAGALPSLAGYYYTLGLATPNVCGTYIETLTTNRAFINEAMINLIRAYDINFKNSVSSYKDSEYVAGDIAISMGKNPKNKSDVDNNFLIQSYKTTVENTNITTMTSATTPGGTYNGQLGRYQGQLYKWNGTAWVSVDSASIELWKKEFSTKKDNTNINLFIKGNLDITGELTTFSPDFFVGADIQELDVSGDEIRQNNGQICVVHYNGYLYNFCQSYSDRTKITVTKAVYSDNMTFSTVTT